MGQVGRRVSDLWLMDFSPAGNGITLEGAVPSEQDSQPKPAKRARTSFTAEQLQVGHEGRGGLEGPRLPSLIPSPSEGPWLPSLIPNTSEGP